MIHSALYSNNNQFGGNLKQRYFSWMYAKSQEFVKSLLTQCEIYFNEYAFMKEARCLDPLGFALFL